MPRGIYPRKPRAVREAKARITSKKVVHQSPKETDDQIYRRLSERFKVASMLVRSVISKESRAVVLSGPPGLGKSFMVDSLLSSWDPQYAHHTIIKGYVRATGLFKSLFDYRHPGNVVVFDDADSIFNDENSLNFLKAACDTTEVRTLSYQSDYAMISEKGDAVPKRFDFHGGVIFITNYDFDEKIERGHKLSDHFLALMSRAHYVDLGMKTSRDYMIRVKQVVNAGMLREKGLSKTEESDVLSYMESHIDDLRELSIRMAIKIAALRKNVPSTWAAMADITCLNNHR